MGGSGLFWVVAFLCNCLVVAPDNLNDDDVTQPLPLLCLCCCLCLWRCLCCCCVNPGKNKQKLDEKHILQEQEKNQNANSLAHTHTQARTHTCTLSKAVLLASTLSLLSTSTSTIFAAADIVKSLRRATFEFSRVCITFTFACGRCPNQALIFRLANFPIFPSIFQLSARAQL